MGAAEKLIIPPLSEEDIDSLMADASDLLMSPDIEPLARALRTALAAHAEQSGDAIVALTLFAAATGAVGVREGMWVESLDLQTRVMQRVYHRQYTETRTLH